MTYRAVGTPRTNVSYADCPAQIGEAFVRRLEGRFNASQRGAIVVRATTCTPSLSCIRTDIIFNT